MAQEVNESGDRGPGLAIAADERRAGQSLTRASPGTQPRDLGTASEPSRTAGGRSGGTLQRKGRACNGYASGAEEFREGGRAGDPGCHVTAQGPHLGFGVPACAAKQSSPIGERMVRAQ